MKFIAIILLSVAAAVVYGILHDQITARICVEYFTIGHPPIFGTDDPTLLAFGWGVLATWWVGVMLGVPLAMAARLGPWPKRSVGSLFKPILTLLVVMAVFAASAGVLGFIAAKNSWVFLPEPLASRVPASRHAPFLTDLWTHLASYLAGFVGGIILIVWTILQRRKSGRINRDKNSR